MASCDIFPLKKSSSELVFHCTSCVPCWLRYPCRPSSCDPSSFVIIRNDHFQEHASRKPGSLHLQPISVNFREGMSDGRWVKVKVVGMLSRNDNEPRLSMAELWAKWHHVRILDMWQISPRIIHECNLSTSRSGDETRRLPQDCCRSLGTNTLVSFRAHSNPTKGGAPPEQKFV